MHLQCPHHKKQIMKGVAYRHRGGGVEGGFLSDWFEIFQSDLEHIQTC